MESIVAKHPLQRSYVVTANNTFILKMTRSNVLALYPKSCLEGFISQDQKTNTDDKIVAAMLQQPSKEVDKY